MTLCGAMGGMSWIRTFSTSSWKRQFGTGGDDILIAADQGVLVDT